MPAYLEIARANLAFYRRLAEQAIAQVDDAQLHWRPDEQANSIAIVMQHLAGNLVSRWTDFLTTDGDKPWRQREAEFTDRDRDRAAIMAAWAKGWDQFDQALGELGPDDLDRKITIRDVPHTVTEAIERGLLHVAYHVGQIVYIARMLAGPDAWQTLSIARGESASYRPKGKR